MNGTVEFNQAEVKLPFDKALFPWRYRGQLRGFKKRGIPSKPLNEAIIAHCRRREDTA